MSRKIVIKLGGSVLTHLHSDFFTECAKLKHLGYSIIIVHGGGPFVSKWMKQLGKEPHFIEGYRVTDDDNLSITEMVLAGKVNKQVVSLLTAHNLSAIGVSGIDLQLVEAKQRNPLLGFVGEVTKVNSTALNQMLLQGWIPVVASLGVGVNGCHYNINADEVASAIAQAIRAHQLILVSDVDGIYIKTGSTKKVLMEATPEMLKQYIHEGEISGGMIPKVRSGMEALHSVDEVWILNGTTGFTQPFIGTRICKEVSENVVVSKLS